MGTVLFLILKILKLINTPFDIPILCGLLSLDSIALLLFLNFREK